MLKLLPKYLLLYALRGIQQKRRPIILALKTMSILGSDLLNVILNRPCVAGAVLKTALRFILSLVNNLNDYFPKKSSKHLHSQTERVRSLTF